MTARLDDKSLAEAAVARPWDYGSSVFRLRQRSLELRGVDEDEADMLEFASASVLAYFVPSSVTPDQVERSYGELMAEFEEHVFRELGVGSAGGRLDLHMALYRAAYMHEFERDLSKVVLVLRAAERRGLDGSLQVFEADVAAEFVDRWALFHQPEIVAALEVAARSDWYDKQHLGVGSRLPHGPANHLRVRLDGLLALVRATRCDLASCVASPEPFYEMDINGARPSAINDVNIMTVEDRSLFPAIDTAWNIGVSMNVRTSNGSSPSDALYSIPHPFRDYAFKDLGNRVIEVRYLGGRKTTDGYRVWRVRY